MYNELEIIEKVQDKTARINLVMDFIVEYSGWLQHLKFVGLQWGSNGEEVGANKEAVKTVLHLKKLQSYIISEI